MGIDQSRLRWNGWGLAAHQDASVEHEEVWTWLAGELGMPSLLATPARALEDIALPASRLNAEAIAGLTDIVGEDNLRTDNFTRAYHARGRSYHDLLHLRAGDISTAPDAVLYPRGSGELAALLDYAQSREIAIIPYGGGSSVVGGVTGTGGEFMRAITLDLTGMARLIDSDQLSLTARAEAGISGPALEKALAARGLTLGHFPQSFEYSTLGGWIAHRGAGQQSNAYGRAEDWLKAVTLITPRGGLSTENYPASAAGPRLTDLICGSEGAFGIIAEAEIRVQHLPAASAFAAYLFPDFARGAAAIREAVQSGVAAAMLRLSDPDETRFYRAYGSIGKRAGFGSFLAKHYLTARGLGGGFCALIANFEGTASDTAHARSRFAAIARRLGGVGIGSGPGKSWAKGRFHGPYLRDPMLDRGVGVDTLETATDWSNVERLHSAVRQALIGAIAATVPRPGARGIVMCHISHSYPDGASLYFTYIFPRALDGEIAQWQAIKRAASAAIASHGGTISHHHGVGEDHRDYLAREKGALGIEVLRAVKHTLDPKGILNPGKLIPD